MQFYFLHLLMHTGHAMDSNTDQSEYWSSWRRLGEAQAAVAAHLVAAGHGYLCSNDFRDVIETLHQRAVR
jgi:hypothetical protein